MKSILDIALWKTRWLFKEKSTWVNMFILPIVFSLIFGGIQSNEATNDDFLVKVGIVPSTTQVQETLLIDVIGHQLAAEVVSFSDKERAMTAMENNEVDALVFWQENFEEAWASGFLLQRISKSGSWENTSKMLMRIYLTNYIY